MKETVLLKILREYLNTLTTDQRGYWYRVDDRGAYVRIRLMTRIQGKEQAVHTAKIEKSFFDEVLSTDRDAFEKRILAELKGRGWRM